MLPTTPITKAMIIMITPMQRGSNVFTEEPAGDIMITTIPTLTGMTTIL